MLLSPFFPKSLSISLGGGASFLYDLLLRIWGFSDRKGRDEEKTEAGEEGEGKHREGKRLPISLTSNIYINLAYPPPNNFFSFLFSSSHSNTQALIKALSTHLIQLSSHFSPPTFPSSSLRLSSCHSILILASLDQMSVSPTKFRNHHSHSTYFFPD